jgi:cell division protease FtsH
VFGSITTGATNDLQRATDLAERMVTSYGMSKVLGPLAYEKGQQNTFLGDNMMTNPRRYVSDETAKAIDDEVKQLVENAHEIALDILNQNKDLMEQIAQQILETEVIEGENLQHLLNQVKYQTKVVTAIA